jgi:hypothetical protein
MIELFCYIARNFVNRGLNPAQYRIVITPLDTAAEADLMLNWAVEAGRLRLNSNKPVTEFREGFISGMPFKIESAK